MAIRERAPITFTAMIESTNIIAKLLADLREHECVQGRFDPNESPRVEAEKIIATAMDSEQELLVDTSSCNSSLYFALKVGTTILKMEESPFDKAYLAVALLALSRVSRIKNETIRASQKGINDDFLYAVSTLDLALIEALLDKTTKNN